ncbi:MAG TPA: HAMP domain-containing sensor histidine kinase [Polyangiaceae bacterium]|jgi:signal transduction histidine kinase
MKIIPKLTAALVAGTCIILGANGWLRVRRERRFFEADRIRDHEIVGRSLEAAAAAVWKSDGPEAAIQAIDAVSSHSKTLGIRWIPRAQTSRLDTEAAFLRGLPAGEPVTAAGGDGGHGTVWKTYVPLDADGVRQGFIELSEPPSAEDRFVRNTVWDTVEMTLSLAVVSALLAFVMGQWLVGTPVQLLSEKARRIGRGDFSGPVTLKQQDELAELAREINAMCDRLATTLDHLRHADRLSTVGKLASGVAHELGTPLNVVGARAKMVSAGETTLDESREYASIIVGATDRMTATIRQLLQFARRDTSRKAPTDLRSLAADAAELLRPLAKQARVDLVLAPGSGDATADVDGGQIQQVITNLVMNAVQAMPQGGTVELSLDTERLEPPAELHKPEGEHLRLRVKDTGQGIAPEHLPHIFEPFFTTKDVGAGTGLGLAVTYGIIRDHGGWIAVDSKVGQGATFSVYLPAPGNP